MNEVKIKATNISKHNWKLVWTLASRNGISTEEITTVVLEGSAKGWTPQDSTIKRVVRTVTLTATEWAVLAAESNIDVAKEIVRAVRLGEMN